MSSHEHLLPKPVTLEFVNFFKDLFQELKTKKVCYAILRHFQHLPYAYPKNEIGLLVDFKDISKFVDIIALITHRHQMGFLKEIKFGTSRIFIRSSSGEHYRFDIRHMLVLDIPGAKKTTRVRWRVTQDIIKYIYPDNSPNFLVLKDKAYFLSLLCYFLRKPDRNYLIDELRILLNSINESHIYNIPRNLLVDLLDDFSNNNLTSSNLDRVADILKSTSQPLQCIPAALFYGARNIWKTSQIVYFSGPDGSGKTTAIKLTREEYQRYKISSKFIYVRNLFLRKIGKILLYVFYSLKTRKYIPLSKFIGMGWGNHYRSERLVWKVYKFFLLVLVLADNILSSPLMLIYRLIYQNVFVEISPYDYFVKYHMPRFTLLEWLGKWIIPKPNLWFVVYGMPDKIHQRRSELTAEEIQQYYLVLENITKRIPSLNIVSIPNNDSFDAYRSQIIANVFSWHPNVRKYLKNNSELSTSLSTPIKSFSISHKFADSKFGIKVEKEVICFNYNSSQIAIKTYKQFCLTYLVLWLMGKNNRLQNEVAASRAINFVLIPKIIKKGKIFDGWYVTEFLITDFMTDFIPCLKYSKKNGEVDESNLRYFMTQAISILESYRKQKIYDIDFISDNLLINKQGRICKIDNELFTKSTSTETFQGEFSHMVHRFYISLIKHFPSDKAMSDLALNLLKDASFSSLIDWDKIILDKSYSFPAL